jgi:hypothetical protein
MPEVEQAQLKEAVEHTHGGSATFAQSVPILETFEGKIAWEGWCMSLTWPGIRPLPAPTPGHRR